jgi:hypothetical protein
MEDVKAVIIPTRSKAKISHELSFPIGAEQISIALAAATQLPQLVIDFCSDRFNQVRFGHYPFLSVMYSRREKPSNPISSSAVAFSNIWEIVVRPVPRILRHRIQEYILDSALPQVKQWLDQRVNLTQPGSDTLGFYFDERNEEFIPKELAHLQPIRGFKQRNVKTIGTKSPAAKPKKENSRP